MNVFRKTVIAATCVGSLVAMAAPASAQTTLRVVMHSDLKILDPIWTTAYIVRNHGYMIYDVLLAQDEKGEIKPQMVEKYEAAADGKGYTFTLRDGLLWHDGQPVTSEDCIASIKRWAAKDSLGQKMMTFVDSISAVDAKTFTIKLKEPTGLVLLGLSKPSSNVPFMMPKRVAETDPGKQLQARLLDAHFGQHLPRLILVAELDQFRLELCVEEDRFGWGDYLSHLGLQRLIAQLGGGAVEDEEKGLGAK